MKSEILMKWHLGSNYKHRTSSRGLTELCQLVESVNTSRVLTLPQIQMCELKLDDNPHEISPNIGPRARGWAKKSGVGGQAAAVVPQPGTFSAPAMSPAGFDLLHV